MRNVAALADAVNVNLAERREEAKQNGAESFRAVVAMLKPAD
jgi:hypothetical protein